MTIPETELENPNTRSIDSVTTIEAVRLINEEDKQVADAVETALPEVAKTVDEIVLRISNGGRLFYIGTGTSGRLGVLDAAELPPTFGVSPDLVCGIIAGGYDAMHSAVEASEDNPDAGRKDLEDHDVCDKDAVVGIAASGTTPYTIGAIRYAKNLGCYTAAITCNPGSEITKTVDSAISVSVGPEAITGSTRMKAGTAQKMVLNIISTVVMIRLGFVKGNRMTNLLPRNEKLRERSLRILENESGLDRTEAAKLLRTAKNDLKIALVMSETGVTPEAAKEALRETNSAVSAAIEKINTTS